MKQIDDNKTIDMFGETKMPYKTLLEAQMGEYPDSVILTEDQMFQALATSIPDWLIGHKIEDWDMYEARYEMGVWVEWYYNGWKRQQIEQTRARWARNAFIYRSENPQGFFYACSKRPDGTYRYVGFRYGTEGREYISAFDGMGYKGETK